MSFNSLSQLKGDNCQIPAWSAKRAETNGAWRQDLVEQDLWCCILKERRYFSQVGDPEFGEKEPVLIDKDE